jgi:exopolyphosphatase/guanosine-5'-triphosphate,3'-diphosphate pyrophosphatase
VSEQPARGPGRIPTEWRWQRVDRGRRLAVLDIGSNMVNMLVVDADADIPLPVRRLNGRSRLAELVERDGTIGPQARRRRVALVAQAADQVHGARADAVFAYATAVVRDAATGNRCSTM